MLAERFRTLNQLDSRGMTRLDDRSLGSPRNGAPEQRGSYVSHPVDLWPTTFGIGGVQLWQPSLWHSQQQRVSFLLLHSLNEIDICHSPKLTTTTKYYPSHTYQPHHHTGQCHRPLETELPLSGLPLLPPKFRIWLEQACDTP
jgi:hypothetical protein